MDEKTYKVKSKEKHSFRVRPTWQHFCMSDHPSVCHPFSSGNTAKKNINKLFGITAVPMGTDTEAVPTLTLICTNGVQAVLAACCRMAFCTIQGRVHDLLSVQVISKWGWSATRGKTYKMCSFVHFPSLIKTTHSQRLEQQWAVQIYPQVSAERRSK